MDRHSNFGSSREKEIKIYLTYAIEKLLDSAKKHLILGNFKEGMEEVDQVILITSKRSIPDRLYKYQQQFWKDFIETVDDENLYSFLLAKIKIPKSHSIDASDVPKVNFNPSSTVSTKDPATLWGHYISHLQFFENINLKC